MKRRIILAVCICLAPLSPGWAKDNGANDQTFPPFSELYSLIESNATGISKAELNNAAVSGLLEHLGGAIQLVTNTPVDIESKTVLKTAVFDGAFGYIRVGLVEPGLAETVKKAHAEFQSTNKLKGLVLDLRFAGGYNYTEAAAVADLFLSSERPLLDLGNKTVGAKDKAEAITTPTAVLVNRKTVGAAEALASVMRSAAEGIVIGQRTAGEARVFREFTLSTGQKVKLATEAIRLANGTELPSKGILPDIQVAISPEEELAYLDDPFRTRSLAQPAQAVAAANGGLTPGSNNGFRRPRNESELIRMRREGIDVDAEMASAPTEVPMQPVLTDPVLARAVDFLKGLALVQQRASGQ